MTAPQQDDTKAGSWLQPRGTTMSGAQKNTGLLAAALLFGGGVFTLWEFLPALAWIVIFSIALWPVFSRLAQRWPRRRRDLLPAGFVLGIVLIFVVPVVLIAVPLASDAHDAAQWLGQVEKTGMAPPQFLAELPFGGRLTALWQDRLSQPGQLSTLTTGAVKGGAGKLAASVGRQTVHRLVLLGFMLLGLFFFLRDGEDVIEQLRVGSRRAFGAAGEDVGQQIISSVHGTVNGLVLVGLGEGVLLGLAYLATGVPHPTLFGLLTVILAMVPFGAAFAIAAAAAVLLVNGSTVGAIVIVALGAVVTFIADHFVRPVLIGGTTRLPFFWVLLGILGGVSAWGLAGLFIGPALMAALILLWREWVGSQKGPLNPDMADAAAATDSLAPPPAIGGGHG